MMTEKISHDVNAYAAVAVPHLSDAVKRNAPVMERLASRLVEDVRAGKSLLVFGSGHSAIFPLELYHRAGGASFVIPIVADYLMPQAGPPVVRVLERTPGVANMLLARAKPRQGEMLWLSSQSGINAAIIDLAIEAKKQGLVPVAFTSVVHSSAVKSRHPSGKRLFEVCDEVVDFGGKVGDAAIPVAEGIVAGPLSTLTSVLLGHSIVVAAAGRLEALGTRCVYTSVNTPEGEARNRALEVIARERDVLLS
ncbi:MAG: sugar isomerase domain-containing protein [Oligoflexia bacterium]|nr:sugar isomerase domain-containing protein [Oligoflexia bacterium]